MKLPNSFRMPLRYALRERDMFTKESRGRLTKCAELLENNKYLATSETYRRCDSDGTAAYCALGVLLQTYIEAEENVAWDDNHDWSADEIRVHNGPWLIQGDLLRRHFGLDSDAQDDIVKANDNAVTPKAGHRAAAGVIRALLAK